MVIPQINLPSHLRRLARAVHEDRRQLVHGPLRVRRLRPVGDPQVERRRQADLHERERLLLVMRLVRAVGRRGGGDPVAAGEGAGGRVDAGLGQSDAAVDGDQEAGVLGVGVEGHDEPGVGLVGFGLGVFKFGWLRGMCSSLC
jgi:hypothetical protein